MRSLLIRIFVSFWSIIVITIIAAAALGFWYAERTRETMQNFEVSDAVMEASSALNEDGREGLTDGCDHCPVRRSRSSIFWTIRARTFSADGCRRP